MRTSAWAPGGRSSQRRLRHQKRFRERPNEKIWVNRIEPIPRGHQLEEVVGYVLIERDVADFVDLFDIGIDRPIPICNYADPVRSVFSNVFAAEAIALGESRL